MTTLEEGVLLLCSFLGENDAHPLTMPQFRELGHRVRADVPGDDPLRELRLSDLLALGYDESQGARILSLLGREEALGRYMRRAEELSILPITRVSASYPTRIIRHRRFSCPPVLFTMGDVGLLEKPSVALVGSRALRAENEAFARAAGQWAAQKGLILVSGGASGADQVAQNACLEAGGSCVIFTADQLTRHKAAERVLYLSADGYDLPFSAHRALHRNGLIHMQADRVMVAQCRAGKGGTWQGCMENFKHGWSEVFVFDDGSRDAAALVAQGAIAITRPEELDAWCLSQQKLF